MSKKILLLIVFILYILFSFNPFHIENSKDESVISVEVKGQVLHEGLYELKTGSTVNDLIELSGFSEKADLSEISLNETLYNDEIIVIPEKTDNSVKKVSLNSASKEELMSLSGIGEKTAEKIIEYRNDYSFHKIEELMNVSGIGEKKFERIKEFLTL